MLWGHDTEMNHSEITLTAVIKQSITPEYTVGLFIILVLITSAGVPIVAATKPAEILTQEKQMVILMREWQHELKQSCYTTTTQRSYKT